MTTVQLKVEIEKELDKLPEEALSEVLDYVKKLQPKKTTDHITRIINENLDLFQKLAQ
ncbi:DUF2281 domain-containing protein [Mucilaginibacter jinjuensis]|uniref:DUF2281 domain-containing protein n=1 Tax=Mucilaginibacter jinjuensis TaxID=1176721 RepID=UPI003B589BF3